MPLISNASLVNNCILYYSQTRRHMINVYKYIERFRFSEPGSYKMYSRGVKANNHKTPW